MILEFAVISGLPLAIVCLTNGVGQPPNRCACFRLFSVD